MNRVIFTVIFGSLFFNQVMAQTNAQKEKHGDLCPAVSEMMVSLTKTLFADLTEYCVGYVPSYDGNTGVKIFQQKELVPLVRKPLLNQEGCPPTIFLTVGYEFVVTKHISDGDYSYTCKPYLLK